MKTHSTILTSLETSKVALLLTNFAQNKSKLDGVSPVDNRPSINYLKHFVKNNNKKKCDNWHLTPDTWQLTPGIKHVVGGEHFLKILGL